MGWSVAGERPRGATCDDCGRLVGYEPSSPANSMRSRTLYASTTTHTSAGSGGGGWRVSRRSAPSLCSWPAPVLMARSCAGGVRRGGGGHGAVGGRGAAELRGGRPGGGVVMVPFGRVQRQELQRRELGGCGGVFGECTCLCDCPFPSWLPSAPPAPAPSSAPRLVTLAVTQAATASSSRPSKPLGRVASRGPPTATFPAPASCSVTSNGCANSASPTTMTLGTAFLTGAQSIGLTTASQMPLSCCGGAMQRPTRCGWTAAEPGPATSGTAMCARRGTADGGTSGFPRAVPTPASHRTTASAQAADRPWPTATWSRSSTEPAAAGWSTTARTAHAVRMGAKGEPNLAACSACREILAQVSRAVVWLLARWGPLGPRHGEGACTCLLCALCRAPDRPPRPGPAAGQP
jgi:hypothetical protein